MSKVVLTTPASFVNDASAVAQEAVNNAAITAALENTLSRDGTGPNSMGADLDMNSHRILNLPKAVSPLEPVRLQEAGDAITAAAAAAVSATAASGSATAASASAVAAAASAEASSVSNYGTRSAVIAATVPAETSFIRTAGYATVGDGGSALYKRVATQPSHEGKIHSADGAWWELSETRPNAKMFGAKGDGTTDDLAAITNCLVAFLYCELPDGDYKVSDQISIPFSFGKSVVLKGRSDEWWGVNIVSSNASKPTIYIPEFHGNATISGLTVSHSVTPTAGGDGIRSEGAISGILIKTVRAKDNYSGFFVGVTDNGYIQNTSATNNYHDGYHFERVDVSASTAHQPMQWQLEDAIATLNDGWGYNVVTNANPAHGNTVLGSWTNIRTFGNQVGGANFAAGPGAGIYDIILTAGFFGDNGPCIQLATFGTNNRIIGVTAESAGLTGGGRNLANAPSNSGSGINITSDNDMTQIIGCMVMSNANPGIVNGGSHTVFSGNTVQNNGVIATSIGIMHSAGSATITGNSCTGVAQQIGIYVAADNATVVGNDCSGNISSGVTVTGGPYANVIVSGNLPLADNLALPVSQGGTGAITATLARTGLGAAPLASPAFTGNTTTAGSFVSSQLLGAGSTLNGVGSNTAVVAGGSNVVVPGANSGLVFIRENTSTGAWALCVTNGGSFTIISQSAALFVVTTTPAAGKYGVQFDGTDYRVYNGAAVTQTFSAVVLRVL